MRLDIRYRTAFVYDDLVRESQNELRACPASDAYQQLISYRVVTSPSARVLSFLDHWGTRVDAFGVREPHVTFEVVAEASVETTNRPLVTTAPRLDALRDEQFVDAHVEYLSRSPHADWRVGVSAAAEQAVRIAGGDVVSSVLAIHRFVGGAMSYSPGSTYVGVDIERVLRRREGVCQDFAHLAVAMCRSIGVPARYVSGYLFTVDDSTGADAEGDVVSVQTHAWFEAAVPGFGWLALDPTNQQQVGVRHVKIGHGRDYDDVPPLRGVYAGTGRPEVEVSVEIRRMTASPTASGRPDLLVPRRTVPVFDPFGDAVQAQQQQQQQQ